MNVRNKTILDIALSPTKHVCVKGKNCTYLSRVIFTLHEIWLIMHLCARKWRYKIYDTEKREIFSMQKKKKEKTLLFEFGTRICSLCDSISNIHIIYALTRKQRTCVPNVAYMWSYDRLTVYVRYALNVTLVRDWCLLLQFLKELALPTRGELGKKRKS